MEKATLASEHALQNVDAQEFEIKERIPEET